MDKSLWPSLVLHLLPPSGLKRQVMVHTHCQILICQRLAEVFQQIVGFLGR